MKKDFQFRGILRPSADEAGFKRVFQISIVRHFRAEFGFLVLGKVSVVTFISQLRIYYLNLGKITKMPLKSCEITKMPLRSPPSRLRSPPTRTLRRPAPEKVLTVYGTSQSIRNTMGNLSFVVSLFLDFVNRNRSQGLLSKSRCAITRYVIL